MCIFFNPHLSFEFMCRFLYLLRMFRILKDTSLISKCETNVDIDDDSKLKKRFNELLPETFRARVRYDFNIHIK